MKRHLVSIAGLLIGMTLCSGSFALKLESVGVCYKTVEKPTGYCAMASLDNPKTCSDRRETFCFAYDIAIRPLNVTEIEGKYGFDSTLPSNWTGFYYDWDASEPSFVTPDDAWPYGTIYHVLETTDLTDGNPADWDYYNSESISAPAPITKLRFAKWYWVGGMPVYITYGIEIRAARWGA